MVASASTSFPEDELIALPAKAGMNEFVMVYLWRVEYVLHHVKPQYGLQWHSGKGRSRELLRLLRRQTNRIRSKQVGHRTVTVLVVGCILAAVLLITCIVYGREPLLMTRATRVNSAAASRSAFQPSSMLSSDLAEIQGKEYEPFQKLRAALNKLHTPAPDTFQMFREQASPDGKWLLLYRFTDNLGNGDFGEAWQTDTPLAHKIVVLSVDGTQKYAYTRTAADTCVIWGGDSMGWMEVTPSQALFYPLKKKGATLTLPVTLVSEENLKAHGLQLQQEIGRSGDTVVVPCDFTPHKYQVERHIYWCLINLGTSPITLRPIAVAVPPGHNAGELMLSPDGKRIAFISVVWPFNSLMDWVAQHLPLLKPRSKRPDTILWVCNTDGTDLREIGMIPESSGNIGNLAWSKSGSSLFFTHAPSHGKRHFGETTWSVKVE